MTAKKATTAPAEDTSAQNSKPALPKLDTAETVEHFVKRGRPSAVPQEYLDAVRSVHESGKLLRLTVADEEQGKLVCNTLRSAGMMLKVSVTRELAQVDGKWVVTFSARDIKPRNQKPTVPGTPTPTA